MNDERSREKISVMLLLNLSAGPRPKKGEQRCSRSSPARPRPSGQFSSLATIPSPAHLALVDEPCTYSICPRFSSRGSQVGHSETEDSALRAICLPCLTGLSPFPFPYSSGSRSLLSPTSLLYLKPVATPNEPTKVRVHSYSAAIGPGALARACRTQLTRPC